MKSFALSITLSLAFLVGSVRAMRRYRLREHTALLWMFVSIVMVVLSLALPTHLLDDVSKFVGIAYSPELILLLAILFLMGLVFYLSLSLDRVSAKQTALIQEIGLMNVRQREEGTPLEEAGEYGSVTDD
ncbi:MAG: DUF2304 domain-containing protein [Acidimicrobiales bacterium]